jgi:hypothetical protein
MLVVRMSSLKIDPFSIISYQLSPSSVHQLLISCELGAVEGQLPPLGHALADDQLLDLLERGLPRTHQLGGRDVEKHHTLSYLSIMIHPPRLQGVR